MVNIIGPRLIIRRQQGPGLCMFEHLAPYSDNLRNRNGTIRRALTRAVLHVVSVPVRSSATVGRGMMMAASVLRYSVTDAITLRLPFGEVLVQAWTLLKVTATPALLMAIPIGAIVSIQTAGLVNQVGASSLVGAASEWASCDRALR